MHHRWCILGTPRSGSTRFEVSIFEALPTLPKGRRVRLAEYLSFEYALFHDTQEHIFMHLPYDDPFRVNLRNRVEDLMINRPEYSFVLRIFFQDWMDIKIDYQSFLTTLQNNNFKFIKLEGRSQFDRTISWAMARSTGVWHRKNVSGQEEYITKGDVSVITPRNKLTIDPVWFKTLLDDTKLYDFHLEKYASQLDHCVVNYDTMTEDCIKYGIPFRSGTLFTKTYDNNYSELIENYQELLDLSK